ncbi:MAG TPA: hypothetical protein PKL77_09635 [Candidatus Omnitrophota bacterium]|nr:hypothetical protein [Candidatus Omnitrophota bacterium]
MNTRTPKNVKPLFIDLETKSREPIEHGPTRYFADKDADWLICATVDTAGKSNVVTNYTGGKKIPDKILNHKGLFVAHNWFFEWSFFNKFYPGTRAADFRNWMCTAALARWFGICAPRAKLEEVAEAFGLEKMPEGRALIARYSIPQKDGSFKICTDKEDAALFEKYCLKDAELSKAIYEKLDGKGFVIEEFRAAQAIDIRGVPIDVKAAKFLLERKERDKKNAVVMAEKIAGRTPGGALVLSASGAFVEYIKSEFDIEIPDARAATLDAIDFSDHPNCKQIENIVYVRKLLTARAGDKASLILDRVHDGRVRSATVMHAAGTGRFQSWGVNFFNFSRQSVEDWEKEKNTAPVPALQRGIICAPKGKTLTESDWRGIENYLSLYYAGDKEQLARIEAGESPYLIFGEKLYGEKITKADKRYVPAKAGVLGCLAAGTNVLTKNRGYVKIETVTEKDLLWDGDTWVKHGGILLNGLKSVILIESRNIYATPDHWILSEKGWRTSVEINIDEAIAPPQLGKRTRGVKPFLKSFMSARNVVSVCAAYAELKKNYALINFGAVKDYFANVVPSHLLVNTEETPTDALISWLIQNLEDVGICVTIILKKDAETVVVKTSRGMAVAEFNVAFHPLEIFWNTLLRCAGLTSGVSRWIELITMGTMNPETYESYLKKLTMKTVETYDIKDVGKNNCYMTSGGLVHNCGYGAGAKKFSIIYRLPIETATKVRDGWHKANPLVVALWYELHKALVSASVYRKEATVKVFSFSPLGDANDVKITLPDGHVLYYRGLDVHYDEKNRVQIMRDGQALHGGLLLENLMQATCARLLYRALAACEREGLATVLHIYDSIMIESEIKNAKKEAEMLRVIQCDPPWWAPDMKLAVDQHTGRRWTKS